ncbi:L-threonylcarbamoyladenylate synthase [Opitutus sp. ER46]|uniref:L-threonylcarbamoyladenylate synthase n=1 Tax=Opitutus sp. ER46 TaxID=2161864 RepID=UPI000D313309|nr:L-threonylcarbamoyladenylate synthase [Opitutus sp. ER46]PTX91626.1 threonylcarbamoyl-AMP synthase [Opitutus sp. ER46]
MTKPVSARTLRPTPRNLALLARKLRAGELVAAPTETVYGLAANALDAKACRGIFRAKRRPANDPLIVHLYAAKQLPEVCRPNDSARRLAAAFWPGPLTLVLPKTDAIPAIVTAGKDSVAVRVPAHRVFRQLLKLSGLPLAAPSANPFGYVSPTSAAHVRQGLGERIGFILDGGECPIGLESTIVDLRDEATPRLLRPGAVTREQLEAVLGRKVEVVKRHIPVASDRAQVAPGMLTRHYSPRTPVELHATLSVDDAAYAPREAFLFLQAPAGRRPRNVFSLDTRGDLRRAARGLFAALRRLDEGSFARIHVELAPGDGIADAINDRLRRAAAKR